ncbi:MAG: GntP family permease [Acidobacteriota bacterium]
MWLIIILFISVLSIILMTTKLKLHPFLALLAAAFGYGIFCGTLSLQQVVEAINNGFGRTVGSIGIVILAGAVIGTFLEKSGGAYRLAEKVLKITGEKHVPLAMGIIGSIVSIPVFCDSGFVILSPLNKTLSKRAGVGLAASTMALSLGLLATHSMVPPTPGPLAAAEALGADIGLVILWGLLVGAAALTGGWLFAILVASRVEINTKTESITEKPVTNEKDTPSALRAIIPIILPLVLIVFQSFNDLIHPFGEGSISSLINFFGQPIVALLIGACAAFTLPKKLTTEMLSARGWVGEAIMSVTSIIIITGAGGAFGRILQESDIASVVENNLMGVNLGILLPILIAAALKTAQGSGTVAIITTAGIMAPLMESFGLDAPAARALVVVGIGAGSMMVSHANDSYFWVVTQLSHMTVKQGYRLQTLGSLVQGLVAAVSVWVISLLFL